MSAAGVFLPGSVERAARMLRDAPASPQATTNFGFLNWVYVYTNKPDRYLDAFEAYLQTSGYLVASGLSPLWHSSFAPVRKAARFKPFARKAGLVDYWRAKGWPDLCHPIGADDLACE